MTFSCYIKSLTVGQDERNGSVSVRPVSAIVLQGWPVLQRCLRHCTSWLAVGPLENCLGISSAVEVNQRPRFLSGSGPFPLKEACQAHPCRASASHSSPRHSCTAVPGYDGALSGVRDVTSLVVTPGSTFELRS